VALGELGQIGRDISLVYAQAVWEVLQAAGLSAGQVDAIAAHGQTLYHAPPVTIQWFDPALVAAQVGCAVVSDFRRADCAVGGQGAPLVPFADWVLFSHPEKNRVLLNIGGIANLTYLKAGGAMEEVIAFDTGPGNCVSDWLMRTYDPASEGFDFGGEHAARGMALGHLVANVLEHDYFLSPPPKSTDGPAMVSLFAEEMARVKEVNLDDLLASACAVTITAVHRAIERFLPGPVDELIVSGGGARNQVMMTLLGGWVNPATRAADQIGMPGDAKEAVAFALLGAATLEGIAANVPSCTGARRGVVLGSVTPKP
jgi:anhydro-N-acetylmuramic acid kinase